MKLFNIIIAFIILSSSLNGQPTSSPADLVSRTNANQIPPGVVVEKIDKGSAGERAGLKESDVIVKWTRDDAYGSIDSPFDVTLVELEQGPRGNVTLIGLRGKDTFSWT